jgi:hypothetical protein
VPRRCPLDPERRAGAPRTPLGHAHETVGRAVGFLPLAGPIQ